jgi:hypothetical protein
MSTIPVPGTVVQVGSQVSPSGDTGLGGPAGPAPNQGIVIGGTVAEPNFPGGVIVPSYKGHPDAIWTPQTAFDDHFDGASLDPKWVVVAPTAGAVTQLEVAGSALTLACRSSLQNATVILYSIYQLLPNANNFDLSLHFDPYPYAYWNSQGLTATPFGYAEIVLENQAGTGGMRFLNQATSGVGTPPVGTSSSDIITVGGTYYVYGGTGVTPKFFKMHWDATAKTVDMYWSVNGRSWILMATATTTNNGFSTTPPYLLRLRVQNRWLGGGFFHCDWVKFVNT